MADVHDGLVRQAHWQGLQVWEVCSTQMLARISCFGGQLLCWQPHGQEEVFWCSRQLQPPRALRGGVPLCWPWFGPHPQDPGAPAHGLARTARWQLDQASVQDDGRVRLCLSPSSSLHPGLDLQQELILGGDQLEHAITSHNVGSGPQLLSQALHSYFRVADVSAVRVHGLDGVAYLDALQQHRRFRQHGPWQFQPSCAGGRTDRVYLAVDTPVVLEDPSSSRRLQLACSGGQSLVLWTPGPELGGKMADVGVDWAQYLCLEAGNVADDARLLQPGQRHRLQQTIRLLG